jgi:hypothetical protein
MEKKIGKVARKIEKVARKIREKLKVLFSMFFCDAYA